MMLNSFNLKTKEKTQLITIDGMEVNVKQYLPAEEKNNLLQISLQSAGTSTILDTFALDVIFHTYLVVKYTDIQFTEEDLNDVFKLYDKLETNNIINAVIAAIPEEEYITLTDSLDEMVTAYNQYSTSSVVVFDKIINFVSNISEEIKNLDPEALKQIISSLTPNTAE